MHNSGHPFSMILQKIRYTPLTNGFGCDRPMNPRMYSDDPSATAFYMESIGVPRPGGALVDKDFGSWRSVWCAAPGIPAAYLAELAARAGVHRFTDRTDQVFAAPDWFGIHFRSGGLAVIHPRPGVDTVTEAGTGKTYTVRDSVFTLEVKRGQTGIFLESGKENAVYRAAD